MYTLTITYPDGRRARRTIRPGEGIRVGRGRDSDWALASLRVSAKHATLRATELGVEVRDEESKAGVKLAGERIEVGTWCLVPLGVHVSLGDVDLVVTTRTTGAFSAPHVAITSDTLPSLTSTDAQRVGASISRRRLGLILIALGAAWTAWVILSVR